MERFALSKLDLENYGSCVVEDFVPCTKDKAIISAGPGYRELTVIAQVEYRFDGVLHLENPIIIQEGDYLRLGHIHGDDLIYSDGWENLHQPFYHEGDIYYTDDAPNGRIYKNGSIFINHWPGIAEIGNPWVHEDRVWFEARYASDEAPEGWWIYTVDMNGEDDERVCQGANPCIYEDTLYYGLWNGKTFDIARRSCKMN